LAHVPVQHWPQGGLTEYLTHLAHSVVMSHICGGLADAPGYEARFTRRE
jgi:hypothetical protein